MSATPHFHAFAIDCPDPRALGQFYADLLGYRVTDDSEDGWVDIEGDGPTISFQKVEDYAAPQWPDGTPQQAHIDFVVEDIAAAHERVLALGGTALDPTAPPEPRPGRGFRVYADPVGHPFCLCRPTRDAWD